MIRPWLLFLLAVSVAYAEDMHSHRLFGGSITLQNNVNSRITYWRFADQERPVTEAGFVVNPTTGGHQPIPASVPAIWVHGISFLHNANRYQAIGNASIFIETGTASNNTLLASVGLPRHVGYEDVEQWFPKPYHIKRPADPNTPVLSLTWSGIFEDNNPGNVTAAVWMRWTTAPASP